jgi:opacity protein-like surface antigen
MMRLVRLVTCFGFFVLAGVSVAQAQTAAEPRWYGEVTAAATLGHKSDTSFGAEGGGRVAEMLVVFAEGGHMGNVGNTDLDARAQKIATFIGGTVGSTAYKMNFFDAGVRYQVPIATSFHPYIALGFGVASITPEATFSVNGTDVTGQLESLGVQLGADLSESQTKPLFVIGGGLMYNFAKRYFVDVTYRYGRTSQAESDNEVVIEALNTQRVQIGGGIRF